MRYAIYAAIDRDPAKLPWAALDSSLAPLPEVRYVEAQAKGGGIQFRASKLQTWRRSPPPAPRGWCCRI